MREEQHTRRTRRGMRLLWRWRSNPLRRRDDVVEAWIVLAVWSVIALGGTLVAVLTAHAADATFARQRSERHAVQAVLAESTTDAALADEATTPGDRVRAKVRWTASDRSTHTGRTLVATGQQAGSKVVVWLDSEGRLTQQPRSAAVAAVDAAFLGAGAALALGGVTYGAGRVARWRLDRRRYDQWGRQWEQIGPQWRRKTR